MADVIIQTPKPGKEEEKEGRKEGKHTQVSMSGNR